MPSGSKEFRQMFVPTFRSTLSVQMFALNKKPMLIAAVSLGVILGMAACAVEERPDTGTNTAAITEVDAGVSELRTQEGTRWCEPAEWHPERGLKECWKKNCCDLKSGKANTASAVYINCTWDWVYDSEGRVVGGCRPYCPDPALC